MHKLAKMEVCHTVSGVADFHHQHKGKSIGFVPTMGALHEGHSSLIQKALEECDVVVCSIFVNPIQFNNAQDLATYPRNESADMAMLEKLGCHLVFIPSEQEIYPEKPKVSYDFQGMDEVMEGAFRPGHFNGVATVVERLFEIVKPQKAYFGQKDFQQLAIIKQLNDSRNLGVEIVEAPTVREKSGLAKSSRNERLSQDQKQSATLLFQSLNKAKELATKEGVQGVKDQIIKLYETQNDVQLEYFELVDSKTLTSIENWNSHGGVTACVAAHVGDVRLIDNMVLFP